MTGRLSIVSIALLAAAPPVPRAAAQALDFTAVEAEVGRHAVDGGGVVYEAPAGSVTTFFGLP